MTLTSEKSNIVAKLSLRRVFRIAVLLGVLIPAALIGTLNFGLQRQSLATDLATDEEQLLDILALGMQEPLWNLNRQSGGPLIESVMADPRVISLRVIDSQSHTVFLSALHNERRTGNVSRVSKPVVYRGETIGQVSIEFDTEHLGLKLHRDLLRLVIVLFAQLALSLLLIMVILHSRFLRPIRILTEQATQLAELKLDQQFSWQRNDEIGHLGRHLEATRSALKHLFDQLRSKTMALEADIARRRDVEEALRASENKYRELFWSNLDGIVISSPDGLIIDANPAFLHLTHYTLEQLKLQNFWSLVASESEAQERFNLNNNVLRFGYCDEFNAVYLSRFGNLLPVSVKTVAMHDAQGQVYAVWRMVRDMSERRNAEEHMQLAAKVFENTAEGIMITDPDLRIRSVNPAFSTITGYSQQEVLGQRPSVLSSGQHDRRFYEKLWQQLGHDGFWQGEVWNRRRDGNVFPAWLAINAVKNTQDEVSHYVAIFSDQTERRAADERIQFLAHYDVLTCLPNRSHLRERAGLAIQNARQDNAHLALLLLDLDRFKTINESLGHAAGDALLQQAAERIQSVLKPGQMVARQGGDEFIVLLPVIADPAEAAMVAESIILAFSPSIALHNHTVSITPSIGISIYPQDGDDFDALVGNADAAMYHSKSLGCNGYKFYTADLGERAHEMLAIEGQLRRALERNEFVLHYQPLVEMGTGRIVGAEALIRWQHPELGLLGPNRFIAVAEEHGSIVPLGNWVIGEACRQQAAWRAAGLMEISLAVNLSALQFRQRDLQQVLQAALDGNTLPGNALDIEVTESVVMDDVDATMQSIHAIRDMGARLSIDDFGTGYSSLSYLKRFKADKLKIDRSFVQDIPDDPDDGAIARAIINLAHTLNMAVVAEGVETLQQWQFLQNEGCDLVQGYLLARPMPADEFSHLLQQGVLLPSPAA
jgi:diguanylate cyclase (GGDEF)-like protein/PAS domain S-box-containing protein